MHAPAAAEALDNDVTLEFAFQDLNLVLTGDEEHDEREAQGFCSIIMGVMGIVPKSFTCGCRVDLKRWVIVFSCTTEICLPKVGILDLTNVCVVPNYQGTMGLNGVLNSTVCNDPMSLGFKLFGFPVQLPLPQVCAYGEHQRGNLQKLSKCAFAVGNFSCPCTVCASGQQITIDCQDVESLGVLAPFAKFECIGLDFFGFGKNTTAGQSFINPFVKLAVDLSEQQQQPEGPEP